MGMMRHPLENSPAEGEILTRHSETNFGLPYKFVASPDTKAFSQAPPAIMDALNRLTWAGQDAVMDGSYRLVRTKMPYLRSVLISAHLTLSPVLQLIFSNPFLPNTCMRRTDSKKRQIECILLPYERIAQRECQVDTVCQSFLCMKDCADLSQSSFFTTILFLSTL